MQSCHELITGLCGSNTACHKDLDLGGSHTSQDISNVDIWNTDLAQRLI